MLSVSRLFPLLAIAVSVLAWYEPAPLLSWGDAIVPLLMLVMFCMGLTLRWQDFRRVWNKPKPLALGVVLQFSVMPLLAWVLANLLQLPNELAIGLMLVGACAGGTASNVITYLAGGDVALSVSMTLLSTLWGVVLTPYLVWFYAGAHVEVAPLAMLATLAQIVLLPILVGLLVSRFLPQLRQVLQRYLADLASAVILFIIAIIVALNAEEVATLALPVIAAVALHNILGLAIGYGVARWSGQTKVEARTIAIEVGMQNSGLGVALAMKYYSPLAALPGALFSIWHNLSGSALASYWQWRTRHQIATQLSDSQSTATPKTYE
ncbi:sodium transporter [Bacterioplanes sanyensis]|uniref:bile acid:sodium symporter family protein n=1 Tax=Bacterioplanes sanyensis TaxID=1249553 RepID=UPI00167A3EF9|nr:bile acid:sodium symporter family protein [Bacterioplanes sanyensis]GGY44371.1 sodium transporter [Bacterioplanes sanyensis]